MVPKDTVAFTESPTALGASNEAVDPSLYSMAVCMGILHQNFSTIEPLIREYSVALTSHKRYSGHQGPFSIFPNDTYFCGCLAPSVDVLYVNRTRLSPKYSAIDSSSKEYSRVQTNSKRYSRLHKLSHFFRFAKSRCTSPTLLGGSLYVNSDKAAPKLPTSKATLRRIQQGAHYY